MALIVPEPSTCVMALVGIACGGFSVSRRRKRGCRVEKRVSVPDRHAMILHQFGIDHTRLTFTHSGRPERLNDPEVTGARVVRGILA